MDIEYENIEMTICNIYAPNNDDPKFFQEVFEMLGQAGSKVVIIGGDFNLVLDMEKDKKGGKKVTHFKSREVVKKYMKVNSIVDIWRIIKGEDPGYTWFRRKPKLIAERLDMILVSKCLVPMVARIDNYVSYCSDHGMIAVTIEVENVIRGPGIWKFNTSLTQEKLFVDQFNEITDEIMKQQFANVRKKWDFWKFKVKGISHKYSSRKQESQENKMQVLE